MKRLSVDFEAMVVANQAVYFSAGANLMLLLVAAQEQEWDDLQLAVRHFQNANLALKHAPRPVVVAPQGLALGRGCRSLFAPALGSRATAETYMGVGRDRRGSDSGGRRLEGNLDSRRGTCSRRRRARSVSRFESSVRDFGDGKGFW